MNNCLNDFLSNIRPFLDGENLDDFKQELLKISNYEEQFQSLLKENPLWLERVNKNGVYFLLIESKQDIFLDSKSKLFSNKMCLRCFQDGRFPTIEVVKFSFKN